jgi:Acyl-CoA reductase (LuxC)
MPSVSAVAHQFAHAPALRPFDSRILAFTTALSRALSTDRELRPHAEVQALAFWLRAAETTQLARYVAALEGPNSVLVPRGTVFHVPPSNVDTLFVYSWALSLLVGNRNIVRLSQRSAGVGAGVATVIQELLDGELHRAVAANTRFVRYGHDEAYTRELSALCDVRVLWGGDAAVNTLRAVPLPAHAIELVFPDRYSASAVNAAAYDALCDAERDVLAARFANDAFWFDQRACSSPRLVAWIGSDDAMRASSADFWRRVATAAARRGVVSDAGTVLGKFTTAAACAIDECVEHVQRVSPEVTVVRLASLEGFTRVAPGGGLFHETGINSLGALGPHLHRRDQTLTVFGIPREELVSVAREFNGRGVDRIVPVGQALSFHHHWDGYDLLQQFTRRVAIQALGW